MVLLRPCKEPSWIRNSVSRMHFGSIGVTIAPKSQQEIPVNYKCKNIIANAMSSHSNVRAQGKVYGNDKSATVIVFNHENIKWEGVVGWFGEVI